MSYASRKSVPHHTLTDEFYSAPAPYLAKPGFPDQNTIVPLPIDYVRSLSEQDFSQSGKRAAVDLRPPPAKRIAYRPKLLNVGPWKIAASNTAALLMLPIPSAPAIDRLVGFNPGERTVYRQQVIQDRRNDLLFEDEKDKYCVKKVIGQSTICECAEPTPDYGSELSTLVIVLEELLAVQDKRISLVVTLDRLGEILIGNVQSLCFRNNTDYV